MRIVEIQKTRINMGAICEYKLVELGNFAPHSDVKTQAKICIDFMGGSTDIFDFEKLEHAQDVLNYLDRELGYKK